MICFLRTRSVLAIAVFLDVQDIPRSDHFDGGASTQPEAGEIALFEVLEKGTPACLVLLGALANAQNS
jgi:hypothetical protein